MNLAPPAPKVEPAVADPPDDAGPAVAALVKQSTPPRVSAAKAVEPADVAANENLKPPMNVGPNEPPSLSVPALRGQTGADLEGYVAVLRGAPQKNFLQILLPCIYNERDFVAYGEVKKFVLIKGSSCFVYGDEHDGSPLYAIPLNEFDAVQEDPNRLDPASVTISPRPGDHKPRKGFVTVLLKNRKDGSQAYQLTFDTNSDPGIVKRFLDIVENARSKKSGPVTASVVQAERIATIAHAAQPEI